MIMKKQQINIPTRNNRLVELYKAIKAPVYVLAGVSSITLAVAIVGFVMSKIGIENYYYVVFGIAALLAFGVAFYWEKTIAQTWTEFTRQVVNWEFEGRYQIALGIVICIIPLAMALGSVYGSIWGGYDIAEVTAGEVERKDVAAISSSLSNEAKEIDSDYSKQIKDLQNAKAEAIAAITKTHNDIIKNNNAKAWKAKQSGNDADYEWLSGGKKSSLLRAKQKEIAATQKKYDDMIQELLDQKNQILQSQTARSEAVLISTMEENKEAKQMHRTKKQRHEIGLTWLAAVSSPLYLLLILISSLIEANIGAISVNDLATDEERKQKKQHISSHNSSKQPDKEHTKERVKGNTQPDETIVPQQTQVQTKSVVFDYTQTKSNLNTYLKRINKSGYSDKRMEGVRRYISKLIEAGYKVLIDEKGNAIIDAKSSPTLPGGIDYEIKYIDESIVVEYHMEEDFE